MHIYHSCSLKSRGQPPSSPTHPSTLNNTPMALLGQVAMSWPMQPFQQTGLEIPPYSHTAHMGCVLGDRAE